ncbi:FAD-binding oxidoreductase [Mesorhizobium sp. B2-5-3]|uniref:NAD(P)/FAD-dependent oxidoreductase n=1 Tax=Mesorhizobium sp. B2-5-3 TaxID=2589927 RepID=UPI00112A9C5B|nr:FAD-binding oxidoreductase [Mesorhizobium sp. B2-5-3]TPK26996.1 FAD-binding oxidoreductase [Mesorhizobium sp. B2-5-3]
MQEPKVAEKNTPYWWEAAPVMPLPRQPLAKKLDVVIVGAGYAGLSAGLVLAREGRSVAAFDAMHPGEGASTRNGGITSGSIRPDSATITRRFGEEKAMAIEAEGKVAREFLYDFIKSKGLDCDFRLVGQFKGAFGYEQYEKMARGAERLAKKLRIESYAVPHAEQRNYIGTDFYRGGTVRMDIGGLHPAKFHAELLRVALASGLTVHSQTVVKSIERNGPGFRVVTSAGTVDAGQVLVCTNGYTDGAAPFLRRRLVPVRSRIIVTEELSPDVMARLMPKLMTITEGRQLGFYYRPTPDGKRILLGGRDSSRVGDPIAPKLLLRKGLVNLFPELENVRLSHCWFGNVAMNRDMLPRIFEKGGVVYATGFCGSGVVWAPWIGMRAAHKLMGHGEQSRTAFDFRPPSAIPLYRGNPWFMPAIIQGYRLQDRIAFWRASR